MKLGLKLNPDSDLPPFRQIADQLRAAILSNAVVAGERLPSVREIAGALSVNPLTVARALNELESGGLIESRWGKGNYVQSMTDAQREFARKKAFGTLLKDFLQAAGRLGFSAEETARKVRSVSLSAV